MKEYICPICGNIETVNADNPHCSFCGYNQPVEILPTESADVKGFFANLDGREVAGYVMRDTSSSMAPAERAYKEYFCRKYVFGSNKFNPDTYQERAEVDIAKQFSSGSVRVNSQPAFRNYRYLPVYLPPVGEAAVEREKEMQEKEKAEAKAQVSDGCSAFLILIFGGIGLIAFAAFGLWILLTIMCGGDGAAAADALPGVFILIVVFYLGYKFFTTW